MSDRIATQYLSARRVLPTKIIHVQLEEDFAGWEFSARSIKVKEFQDFQSEQGTAVGLAPTIRLLSRILVGWNFVDEVGEELPLSAESLGELPLELLNEMASGYFKATTAAKNGDS